MSNLVEAVRDYMDVPSDPAGVLRAFASVGEDQYTAEWLATYPPAAPKPGEGTAKAEKRRTASAYRALQKYGLRGGAKGTKKVTRSPDKLAIAKMRRILFARLAPAYIEAKGRIGYSEKDKRYREIKVEPLTLDDLQELLRFITAVEKSDTWDDTAEVSATFVFNGWYFGPNAQQEEVEVDGVTFDLPYDDTLDYEEAVFTIGKSARGRRPRAAA